MALLTRGYTQILLLVVTFHKVEPNDGHYSEEDDAEVLPIVLPIVLVVVIICIVACCWQGKKCPCNKPDDKKDEKKKKQEDEDMIGWNVATTVNEKKVVTRSKSAQSAGRPGRTYVDTSPPAYSSVIGKRQKELPGRVTARDEPVTTTAVTSYKKKAGHSSRSSAYDVEAPPNGRTDERYRVHDNRSHGNNAGRRDQQNHSRHGERSQYSGRNGSSASRQHRHDYAGY